MKNKLVRNINGQKKYIYTWRVWFQYPPPTPSFPPPKKNNNNNLTKQIELNLIKRSIIYTNKIKISVYDDSENIPSYRSMKICMRIDKAISICALGPDFIFCYLIEKIIKNHTVVWTEPIFSKILKYRRKKKTYSWYFLIHTQSWA